MPHSRDIFRAELLDRKRQPTVKLAFLAVFGAFLVVGTLFLGGEYVQRGVFYNKAGQVDIEHGRLPRNPSVLTPLVDIAHNVLPEVRPTWVSDGLLESGLPVYDLRIDPDDLKLLQETAELVTAFGHSRWVTRDYVDADFLLDGEWVPIKVKLRGLTSRHYRKKAASLRLNFPNEQFLDGKEQVNLVATYDKGLTADVTTNWELSRYGILTWSSDFVVLRINGELTAMYQELEQFDRSISDRHRRAEGFIFAGHGQLFGPEGLGYDKALEAFSLLRPCYVAEGAAIPDHCDWRFFEEYFDIEKLAWASAMTVLLNSLHGWVEDNVRLFWDPARGKFEPIPWDYLYYPIDLDSHPEGEDINYGYRQTLYSIPEFRRIRDRRVWSLISERLDDIIAHADSVFDEIETALAYDLRRLRPWQDKKTHETYVRTLRKNSEVLEKLYAHQELVANVWSTSAGSSVVEILNFGKSFIEIDGFESNAGALLVEQIERSPLIVDGYWQGQPGRLVVEFVSEAAGQELSTIRARNGVNGDIVLDASIVVQHKTGSPPIHQSHADEITAANFELDIDGVLVDDRKVAFGPGVVEVRESVTIPEDYDVVFRPGLDLRIGDDVSLVIHGDLDSRGTVSDPIQIHGLSSDKSWGGVFVQGTRMQPSIVNVEHTTVTGGKGGEGKRTYFTSPFSVHDGIVRMRNSTFSDSNTDDGINLKYAEVDIESITITGSLSDSLDCDFCKGTISQSLVRHSGGDGLDFSGSNVVLQDNDIRTCDDKGISIGEGTTAKLEGTIVFDCYIGTAVKDSSVATIEGSQFENLEVGIAMYIKKQTFGPPEATLRNMSMTNVSSRYLHDGGSKLTIVNPDEYDRIAAHADPNGSIIIF